VVARHTQALGRGAGRYGVEGQQQPRDGAEGVEAPLVVAGREGRDEVGDDPKDKCISIRILYYPTNGDVGLELLTTPKTGRYYRQW